jgi:ribosomal-protein-alanine N-acetyltransferase
MSIKIAKMDEQYLPQIMTIERASFANPWTEKAFLGEMKENSFAYYIVCIDDSAAAEGENAREIIGYTGMWTILDEIHITTIAVREDWRGRRIGELLIKYLLQVGRAKGAINATLEVRPSNIPAQRLYERLGFKAYGVRKKYYQDNGEDALIMWKELQSPMLNSYDFF